MKKVLDNKFLRYSLGVGLTLLSSLVSTLLISFIFGGSEGFTPTILVLLFWICNGYIFLSWSQDYPEHSIRQKFIITWEKIKKFLHFTITIDTQLYFLIPFGIYLIYRIVTTGYQFLKYMNFKTGDHSICYTLGLFCNPKNEFLFIQYFLSFIGALDVIFFWIGCGFFLSLIFKKKD